MYGYVNGKRFSFDPAKSVGKGGEADIFDLGSGLVGKVFKPPSHPDFHGQLQDQQAAAARIRQHQDKLRAFPKNLPSHVVAPIDLITNQAGDQVVGYTMKNLAGAELLLRFSQRDFRQSVPNGEVVKIFTNLHQTVEAIHPAPAAIGDFNDLNVLILNSEAFIIDADSFSYGPFMCRVFTQTFVDPILCDPQAHSLSLIRPHNADSDWYAFTVMLMQSLLFVGPYGGVYRPKNAGDRIPHDTRPLKRISVFHPEVKYPKPAVPYGTLPDDLLHHFNQVFTKDQRGIFPKGLLLNLRWTKCGNCGAEHARSTCPECKFAAPAAVKEVTKVHGKVVVTRIFTTDGHVLHSSVQDGKLHWLYHHNGQFKREDGETVLTGELDRQLRFRFKGKTTVIGKGRQVASLTPGQPTQRVETSTYGLLPMFDTNSRHLVWIENGRLLRNGQFAPVQIGEVLDGQTLFWIGEKMGFGFYRAGNLSVAFVFDPTGLGINDRVKLPPLRGQVVDAYCLFGSERAWFFVSTRESGKTINQCVVIRQDGSIQATASAEEGSGGWLSSLRGKCVGGKMLFVPTDEGIIRVQEDNGNLVVVQEFPDTEQFVDSNSQLHVGGEGIYVVKGKEIFQLKMKR